MKLHIVLVPMLFAAAGLKAQVPPSPTSPSSLPNYSVIDIGLLPGGTPGVQYVTGMNNSGQLVGYAQVGSTDHGFVWNNSAGFTDLYDSINATNVFGINNAGQLIGINATRCSFLYSNGAVTATDCLDDFNGINNSAQIAGYNPSTAGAILWSAGNTTLLNICNNLCTAVAYSINDSGQIAGADYYQATQSGRCWLWNGGAVTDLGTPANTACLYAGAVNNIGQVAGTFVNSPSTGDVMGFFWSQSSGLIELGWLSGTYSEVYAMNNNGQVVGDSGYAFVWTQSSGMVNLNTLINDSTWNLSYAAAINDLGQIAGTGLHNGLWSTFLLTPITQSQPTVLVFPVRSDKAHCKGSNGACTPLNTNISSIFDHNQKVPYAKGSVITAYTGETGACNANGSDPYQTIHSPFGKKGHSGFAQANGQAFVVNGNYYAQGESTLTAACGSTTITGSAMENLYLFYDGHPGYDYPFNFAKGVFPSVSGCVSYLINAAGGYGQTQAHTLAIVPLSTKPPGGVCSQPYTSDTGKVIIYLHLASYLLGNTLMVCPSQPNAKGSTTPACPAAKMCSTCPAEGTWVSSDPLITTEPIAYVGNFFSGVWGGVPTHLHFEVDVLSGPLPSTTATPLPVDPYGWNPKAGTDPYSTLHPGTVNTWLWQQASPY